MALYTRQLHADKLRHKAGVSVPKHCFRQRGASYPIQVLQAERGMLTGNHRHTARSWALLWTPHLIFPGGFHRLIFPLSWWRHDHCGDASSVVSKEHSSHSLKLVEVCDVGRASPRCLNMHKLWVYAVNTERCRSAFFHRAVLCALNIWKSLQESPIVLYGVRTHTNHDHMVI